MDILNKLLFGEKYGVCIFCGSKVKLSDSVFHKNNACICRSCNSNIKIAPFNHFYDGTEHLSFVIAPLHYSGAVISAIHNLKFNFMQDVADALCYYINTYISVFEEDEFSLNNFDMLVPVPLSNQRLNERGYNQAELIALNISSHFNIPLEKNILFKTKNTKPQSTLSHDKRKENIKNAYSCNHDVSGKNIILVDDVFTTGNTLDACAKVLKDRGAKTVSAITVTCSSSTRHSQLYYELFS